MAPVAGAMTGEIRMTTESASDPLIPPTEVNTTVFTGRWLEHRAGGKFSPTTATLLTGPTEAVLVDTGYLKQDVEALGNLIADSGKELTTIYVTHGHADHYFGIAELLKRFPNSRAVALPEVVDYIKETIDVQTGQWRLLFGDTFVECNEIPEVLESPYLTVDGVRADVITVDQADISPTSIVHVPDIGVVIAGDAVYNEIHPMLGLSTPQEWQKWLGTIDLVEKLDPTMIIAGHKRPDSNDHAVQTMLATTRAYIKDFARISAQVASADELIEAMVEKYPQHGNRWTLEFSAQHAIFRR